MTVYAFDEARQTIIATWDCGLGCVATQLAQLPTAIDTTNGLAVVSSLTELSKWLWWTYTHPASAAASMEVNTDGWERQQERDAFAAVVGAITTPNLPQAGMLRQSYIRVEEAAHQVGRALHTVGSQELTDQVVADIVHELAAVEQAERGELSGRAGQAVVLTRADVSPVQVAAASELLHADPMGSQELFQHVDPTAASVAAAHWLQAAADVTARVSGYDPTVIVERADDIEALPFRTPTLVLDYLNEGVSPHDVVVGLVKAAMAVAEGDILDPEFLIEQIADAEAQLQDADAATDGEDGAELTFRITPLDPRRPAQDLLEDLLDGIRGCWLIYSEFALISDPEDGVDDDSEEYFDVIQERIDKEFVDAVRVEAAANRERLA